MNNKKKILIFATTYLPFIGGAEIAIWEIVKRNPQIDFDMVTLNLDGKQRLFEQKGNLKIHRVGGSKVFFPVRSFLFSLRLGKFDAIWSMMASYAGFSGLLYSYIYPNTPFILTLQEGDTHQEIREKFKFVWFAFRKIFKRADIVQVISKYLADFARSVDASAEIVVVPNGVDVKKFEKDVDVSHIKKGSNDLFMVTTSRLVKKNSIEDAVLSLKFLPENIKFLVIGDGPLRRKLEEVSEENGLGDRVSFLGEIDNDLILPYLKRSDIFIRPSVSEGFGNSFIEAMAAGLPVIATPVGGIVDFLEDAKTGLFCQVNNPESIAKKVLDLINNQGLREDIIVNASEMVRSQYDWDLIAQRMKKEVFDVVLR